MESTSRVVTEIEISVVKAGFRGESGSLGQRWEKWKRSLTIYLEAMDIRTPIKKRATLLLLGGSGIQEIFYNLPGASVEPTEDNDVFTIAIQKLDEYLSPKQSKEDHLIDQIAEKCLSVDFSKNMLTIEANTLEVVNRQLEEYGQPKKNLEVNSIAQNERDGKAIKPYGNRFKYNANKGCCSRCGNSKYNAKDTNCPARKKKCYLCDRLGHFRQYYKGHGARKRRWGNREDEIQPNKRAKKQSGVDSIEDEEKYIDLKRDVFNSEAH
nr:unnamed protein product [Callosobruchus analis]